MNKIVNYGMTGKNARDVTERGGRTNSGADGTYETVYEKAALKKKQLPKESKGREEMTQEEFEKVLKKFDAAMEEIKRRQRFEERFREEEAQFRRERKKKLKKLRIKREIQKQKLEKERVQKETMEHIRVCKKQEKEVLKEKEEQNRCLKNALFRRKELELFHLEAGKVWSLCYGICDKEKTDLLLEERVIEEGTGLYLYLDQSAGPYIDRENLERLKQCSTEKRLEFMRKFEEITREYLGRIEADSFSL